MKAIAVILLVALSFSGVMVGTVKDIDLSVFFVAWLLFVPSLLVYFVAWKDDLQLHGVYVVAAFILLSTVLNLHVARLTSVAYSFIFLAAFTAMVNAWQRLPTETLVATLKVVIICYAANVAMAQLLVVAGAPDTFLGGFFGREFDYRMSVTRYFGFSSEPSYASFIVVASFYALYRLSRPMPRRELLLYSLLVLYQVYAFRSLYGYLLVAVVAAAIALRELRMRMVIALPLIVIGLALCSDYESILLHGGRLARIGHALLAGDIIDVADLDAVDSSLYMRIAPIFEYFRSIDLTDYRYYFGHGAMASTGFLSNEFVTHVHPDSGILRAGFLPAFLYDYGLVGGLVVVAWVARRISGHYLWLPLLFFAAAIFNANFNTQLFWYLVVVFSLTKICLAHPEQVPWWKTEHRLEEVAAR